MHRVCDWAVQNINKYIYTNAYVYQERGEAERSMCRLTESHRTNEFVNIYSEIICV